MYCIACGTYNEQSAKFCFNCGNAFDVIKPISMATFFPTDYIKTEQNITPPSNKMSTKAKIIWSAIGIFCGIILLPFLGWATPPAALCITFFALKVFGKRIKQF